ncbi:hypothetical protein GQ600_16945 [Phytophthora cactorum]|nr:hypothetical protein GQ600_16945 [Phytophthora cactorum]
MASPDAVVTIEDEDKDSDKDEDEDEERGLFDASSLKALTREADGWLIHNLKGTGVERFFKTLNAKNYNPINVPIPDEYSKLRTLYHSWYYYRYIPKLQAIN